MSSKTKKVGTRAEVWHGTATKTKGGLMKENLAMNAKGRIVSKRKQELGRAAFSQHLKKTPEAEPPMPAKTAIRPPAAPIKKPIKPQQHVG